MLHNILVFKRKKCNIKFDLILNVIYININVYTTTHIPICTFRYGDETSRHHLLKRQTTSQLANAGNNLGFCLINTQSHHGYFYSSVHNLPFRNQSCYNTYQYMVMYPVRHRFCRSFNGSIPVCVIDYDLVQYLGHCYVKMKPFQATLFHRTDMTWQLGARAPYYSELIECGIKVGSLTRNMRFSFFMDENECLSNHWVGSTFSMTPSEQRSLPQCSYNILNHTISQCTAVSHVVSGNTQVNYKRIKKTFHLQTGLVFCKRSVLK